LSRDNPGRAFNSKFSAAVVDRLCDDA